MIYYLAQGYIDVTGKDTEIIYHVLKLLLFDEKDTWMKKQSSLFDVTMGAYDESEVCELVGTYMLSLISEKYNKKDFELYRDDGLGVVRNKCGRETAKIKKNIRQIFKENKLYIVIQCKMKIVDYFDVSLSWNNSNYKPYHKPDIEILYIHKDSNHSHSILKHITTLIEKAISTF